MVTNSHKGTEKTKHGLFTGRTKLCCQKSRTPCKGAEGSESRKGDRRQMVEGPAVRLSLDSNTILTYDPQAPTFSMDKLHHLPQLCETPSCPSKSVLLTVLKRVPF